MQRRLLDLRKSGELPWEWIVDESRSSYAEPRWNNPAGFAETAPWFYRLDFWREQQLRPLVLVEKAGQIPVYLQHAQGHVPDADGSAAAADGSDGSAGAGR